MNEKIKNLLLKQYDQMTENDIFNEDNPLKNSDFSLKKIKDLILPNLNIIKNKDNIIFKVPGYTKSDISIKLITNKTNTIFVTCNNEEFGELILDCDIKQNNIGKVKLENGIIRVFFKDVTEEFDIEID